MGPHEGAAGSSGWNIKPEEIQERRAERTAAMQPRGVRVARGWGAEELDSASRSWRLQDSEARGPLGPPRDKTRSRVTRPFKPGVS